MPKLHFVLVNRLLIISPEVNAFLIYLTTTYIMSTITTSYISCREAYLIAVIVITTMWMALPLLLIA